MKQDRTGFMRVIQRREVLALAFGAMIGWSWMALTGIWIHNAGSVGAMLAFAAGGVAIIFVGLTYAELAAAMPQAGGEHVYSRRALGHGFSFFCTWALLLAYIAVVAFEAVALPTVVEHIFPNYSQVYLWTVAGWEVELTWVLLGVGASVVMTFINVIGIRTAARLQMLVTALIISAGLVLAGGAAVSSTHSLQPLMTDGASGMLGVLVIVPLMLVGFDVIPQSAEEINLPYKAIGKLLVVSILFAIAFYMLIIWSTAATLEYDELLNTSVPTAEAGRVLFGVWGHGLLLLGGIGGILTSWNAFIIGASRAMYSMARDGQLPAWLGDLHPRYRTPWKSVLLIGVMASIAPLFGRQTMVWLVDAGSFGTIVAYSCVALSFLVLRRREPDMERPYLVPFGNLVGLIALVLSLAIAVLFLPGSPAALIWPYEWLIVGGWALLGLALRNGMVNGTR